MQPIVFSIATVLFVVAAVGHLLRLGASGGSAASASASLPDREERRRHIAWRSFYVNPDDPRGWVRKTWGFGWTVNFRTLRNVRIFVALIAGTVVSTAALVWSVMRGA